MDISTSNSFSSKIRPLLTFLDAIHSFTVNFDNSPTRSQNANICHRIVSMVTWDTVASSTSATGEVLPEALEGNSVVEMLTPFLFTQRVKITAGRN